MYDRIVYEYTYVILILSFANEFYVLQFVSIYSINNYKTDKIQFTS